MTISLIPYYVWLRESKDVSFHVQLYRCLMKRETELILEDVVILEDAVT